MAAELVMAEEAEQDIADAYAFYERQRVGLGEDFIARVDACIPSIVRAPAARASFLGDNRRALVRRFPYAVYYTYEDAEG
jgi:plasmid stabilization system protein ParE